MVVEGNLVAQARVICDKMRVTLEAGGLGFSDDVLAMDIQASTPEECAAFIGKQIDT